MKIKTILNNNAIIALNDEKEEVVIVKNGIGFNHRKGDDLKDTDLEKVFVLNDKTFSKTTLNLLSQVSEDITSVSKKIVNYARQNLNYVIHDSIFVTLSDHITLAISRNNKGITFYNPLDWDIKKIYKNEYHISEVALQIIKHDLGVKLPQEEAGLIALHFVNAELNDTPEFMVDMTNITMFIQKILNFVKYYFSIEFDDDSFDSYRFIRHLQYLAKRLFIHRGEFENGRIDDEMMDLMKLKYKKAYDCADKIRQLIKQEYYMDISMEEQFYLLIHINRLIS